jgi:hypothetical protein
MSQGDPPNQYLVTFQGRGLWRDRGKVRILETHRIEIKLGSSYPRTIPEIRWITPIYHPNISEIGMVCLGGYNTHWVPSVQLDELCLMLWDMARYHNYDIRSPYNRDAALWVANQTAILFPTDPRPLRDVRASLGRIALSDGPSETASASQAPLRANGAHKDSGDERTGDSITPAARVRQYLHRYRKILRQGGSTTSERESSQTSPSNPELQALATAMAESTMPVRDAEPADGLIILDSNGSAEPLGTTRPLGDEIVFIE